MKLVRRVIRWYTARGVMCDVCVCTGTEFYKGHGRGQPRSCHGWTRSHISHNHARSNNHQQVVMFQRVYPGQGIGYEATCAAAGTVCRNPPTALKLNGQRITSQYCQFHACRQVEGGRACPNAKLPRAVVCSQRESIDGDNSRGGGRLTNTHKISGVRLLTMGRDAISTSRTGTRPCTDTARLFVRYPRSAVGLYFSS